MPISCPDGGEARYRYAKNKARLAFCGKGDVVEVKTPQGELRHPKRSTRRQTRRDRGR